MTKQEPITLSDEEIEAIELVVHYWTNFPEEPICVEVGETLRNLLERTKNNNEQSEQMKIAREIMKQDSECLRNLSENNDDSIKNSES